MFFEIETGRVELLSVGRNGFIKRGSRKIPVPHAHERSRLIALAQKTGDHKELERFNRGYPVLEEGDIVVSGSGTKMGISIDYNEGKGKPIDDYRARASKSVFMGPNSEAGFSGFESWDVKNEKTKERHYGVLVKGVSLRKGFFMVSISNTEDEILTPFASLVARGGSGTCLLDVCPDAVYCSPIKSSSVGTEGMEFRNLKTGRSFLAKSNMFEEIIVTQDAIYRKGLTKMDAIFQNNVQMVICLQGIMRESIPELDEKDMAKRMKEMPATLGQNLAGIEMLKQMSPEDLGRLMKRGGAKVTPEMMERIREVPGMLRQMEKKGTEAELRKASGIGKAYLEGMGEKNIERMVGLQNKSIRNAKAQTADIAKIGGRSIDDILEHPIRHDPLTKKFGAVKVG